VCGRCGHVTALNSTYCSLCQWILYSDAPEIVGDDSGIGTIQVPRPAGGMGGLIERRRKDSQHAKLESKLRAEIDPRIEALEKRAEDEPDSFEIQRTLGLITLLDGQWERANAHLSRAHQLNPKDCQTHINYAIVLAHSGQLAPALDLLAKARQQWAASPFVLFNQAIIALQARRYPLVLEAVEELEKMWQQNSRIAHSYHDEAMTLRGLAQLYLGQLPEARATLEAAASHTVKAVEAAPASASNSSAKHHNQSPDASTVPAHASVPEDIDIEGTNKSPSTAEAENLEHVTASEAAYSTAGTLEGKVTDADALCNLAIVEAAQGEANRAISRLSAALRLQPGHTHILNNLGVLAYESGNYSRSTYFLQMARSIEEHTGQREPIIANHLGVALSSMGQLEEGLEQLQQAGGQERAEFEVFYNLGRAYIERGSPDKGVEYLRQAFQINPNHPDVHVVLAAAYLLRGRTQFYAEAKKHLLRALQLSHNHRAGMADLSMLLMEEGDGEQALKIVRQSLKVNPHSTEAMVVLGLLTMEAGGQQQWAQAGTFFENALRMRPDLIACLFNMALCQYMVGMRDASAKILESVTAHDPSISPAYFLIGMGHAEAGRYQEALWAWNTASQYEQSNAELEANIAFVHYQRGDFKLSAKHYLKAHHIIPTDAAILGALGLTFARAQMMREAIDAFTRSLSLSPNNPITHSNLGLAFYLVKMVEKAVEEWRLVSQLDRGYAERRGDEMQKSFDDSIVSLRPLDWRARIIRMAPMLPRPHTRLLPGHNARAYRPAIADPALLEVQKIKAELERTNRVLAWMNIKH
jgi:tetratricopeptide (TPR) repeat protein